MNKTDLSNFDNSWFLTGKTPLIRLFWYFVNALFFNTALFPISSLKCTLLKIFGAKIGEYVVIKPKVNIKYPWKLTIGDYSWIGEEVWIDNLDTITIGSNVCISQGALLLSGNHNYKKTTFDLMVAPIIIEEGVWIGAKSIVTQGVTIGSHAILTVGSVTSKNLLPYGIYVGNPAIKIRERVIA